MANSGGRIFGINRDPKLAKLFNPTFHFDYSQIHWGFVHDPHMHNLFQSISIISGNMAQPLISSQADNLKNAQNIIEDEFVQRISSSKFLGNTKKNISF